MFVADQEHEPVKKLETPIQQSRHENVRNVRLLGKHLLSECHELSIKFFKF